MQVDLNYTKEVREKLLALASEAEQSGRLYEFSLTLAVLVGQIAEIFNRKGCEAEKLAMIAGVMLGLNNIKGDSE